MPAGANNDGYFIDYLFSDGTDVYWNYLDARPVTIKYDYSGFEPFGREIVRTSSGTLYTFIEDNASCEVWKSADGTSWTEQDSGDNPTCTTSGPLAVAIDGNDDLHIIYTINNGNDLIYNTVSGDQFGASPDTIFDGTNTIIDYIDISVDNGSYPHIVYKYLETGLPDTHYVKYRNKDGGSLGTERTLESSTSSSPFGPPTITINEDDIPEIAYENQTDSDLTAAVGDGTDPTTFTLQDVDTDVVSGSSIAIDQDGNTWVAYIDEDGTDDLVTLAKHTDSDAWSIWTTNIYNSTETNIGSSPLVAINGRDIYVFYEDLSTDQRIVYDIYDSDASTPSWSGEVVLYTPPSGGDYFDPKAKWAFEWNNFGSNRIDFLFQYGGGADVDLKWSFLHLRRMPNKVDDASDFDDPLDHGRQVVRTSTGVLYSLHNDSGSCEVWKSVDEGNTWSEQDDTGNPTCDSSNPVAMAIDSSDTLHLAYTETTTNEDVKYSTFTTSNDQFGSEEVVLLGTGNNLGDLAITIDDNDVPHIVLSNGTTSVIYRNRVGGTPWAGITVESVNGDAADITINEDNEPEVSYINATDSDLTLAEGDANDPTSFTLKDVDTNVTTGATQVATSIAIDTSGNTWVAYVDENGTDDYIALAYHPDGSVWTADWDIYQTGNVGYEPSIVIDGTDIYIFYEDDQDDIVYDKFDGTTSLGSASKIDDAGDPGGMNGAGKQVVRMPDGTLYGVINDGGTIEVWKSTNGSSWEQQDSGDSPSGDNVDGLAVAIDSGDDLHIAYASGADHKYITFDTGTAQFGSEETIQTAPTTALFVDIAIDSNDKAHAVFVEYNSGATAYLPEYSNRIGGSWKTPINLETVGLSNIFYSPSIVINEDDEPEIAYINSTNDDLTAHEGNQNDATSFTEYDVDTDVDDGSDRRGASIGIDAEGNTWIAYVDDTGTDDVWTDDEITIVKHNDADGWTTWQTPDNSGAIGFEPSLAIYKNLMFIFYEEDSTDQKIVYQIYNGANWSGESDLASTASTDYQDAKVKWAYFNDNQRSVQIDFLYSDNTDIYYNRLELGWDGEKVLEQNIALQDSKAKWSYINDYDSGGEARLQTNTYYFNDTTPTDYDSWTNDSNAFDGSLLTQAQTLVTGSESSNYLLGEDTDAVTTWGSTITSVKARFYGSTGGDGVCNAAIYETGVSLGTAQKSGSLGWGNYTNLSTPSGGWTWSKVQGLDARLYLTGSSTPICNARKVEVLVESTNTAGLDEIDYLFSDNTDVWYNRLILGGITPGTQDAIDNVTAGTNYNLSSISDDTSPNDVHLIYIDDSSPKALMYARWDNAASPAWQTAIVLDNTGGSDNTYATLSLDTTTNDLYAIWINGTDDDINYRQCDVTTDTAECDAIGKWLSTQDGWKTGDLAQVTSNYDGAGRIFAEWTVGTTSPYHVSWDYIIVPEYLWLFFGLGPVLPGFIAKIKKKKKLF